MTVTRYQGIESTTVSFPNATLTAFDVPRPETSPKSPAYAENSDHVVRPPAIKEFHAGHVIIDLPITLAIATVFLRKLEIRSILPTAQKGVPGAADAFFPSGAPTDSTLVRTLVDRGAVDDLAANSAAVTDMLGMALGNSPGRSYPGITLHEGEFVHMELFNGSGGALNAQIINARYKLGLNQSDTGKP